MADLKRFQSRLAEILFSSYGDSTFETIRTFCGGMSGVKTAKLLNFAASCLDQDELYFEIGVFTGFTMISAGKGIARHIIGIDNSSEFGDMRERVLHNFHTFPHPHYQYLPFDFRQIEVMPENKKKVGVLYIDGKHDYKEVMDSFRWGENDFLSDHSIVILDDISVPGISDAISDWLANHSNYRSIFYLKPYIDESSKLWSHDISVGLGFAVLVRTAAAPNAN